MKFNVAARLIHHKSSDSSQDLKFLSLPKNNGQLLEMKLDQMEYDLKNKTKIIDKF